MKYSRINLIDRRIRNNGETGDFFHESPGITTFVNTFSYYKLLDSNCSLNQIDFVYIDGSLQVRLHNIFFNDKINRVSFDFSSIADDIFSYSSSRGYRIALVGATEKEISSAVLNLKSKYGNIDISFCRNGYFHDDAEKYDLYTNLKEKNVQVLIIGMGTPYQEELAVYLKEAGLKSYIFTCGGFITQAAIRIDYYNRFKNGKFRWLQRAIEFKHVRKRVVFNYPINVIRYIVDHIILIFFQVKDKSKDNRQIQS